MRTERKMEIKNNIGLGFGIIIALSQILANYLASLLIILPDIVKITDLKSYNDLCFLKIYITNIKM